MACDCQVVLPGPSVSSCGGSTVFLFMALLEDFLRSQCDIEDPCGHIVPRSQPDYQYDFIVVGGGAAGSVVANRLSEVPGWRVLLVEAGVNEPTGGQVPSLRMNFLGSSIDWQYKTEPEDFACLAYPDRRCSWPRGKVIGGTTSLNGMIYMRGNRKDYDGWEALGNAGWSYKDVLRYFLKSENNLQLNEVDSGYHSSGGYLPVSRFPYRPQMSLDILRAVQELGKSIRDLNGESQTGFTITQSTSRNGIRFSASRSFLRPVRNRPNLHIMLNTTATRVLLNPRSKRALGVEIVTPEGTTKRVLASKEVIVCGGIVNSPKLLLLSGIGDQKDLEEVDVPVVHHLPGVGRNLHDQASYLVPFTIDETAVTDLNILSATHYFRHRNGPMSAIGITQSIGFINSKYVNSLADYPDVEVSFFGYSANCSKTGLIGELTGPVVNGTLPRRPIIIAPTVVRPKSRGCIKLRDNNPLSHPKIFANYLTNFSDVATLIEGIKFAISVTETEALAKYGFQLVTTPARGCEDVQFGTDVYWECAVRANTFVSHHQAGSCKMAPRTDPEAVVDEQLRVWGVRGLRVVDASVMPRVTTGNTMAPTIMIAEKGSDMIKAAWRKT